MTPAELAQRARGEVPIEHLRDVARGIATADDVWAALEPTAVVVAAPGREPGDDEEDLVATGSGLIRVRLYTETAAGPVDLSAQEAKRAIAQSLKAAVDDAGAPVLYMTAGGLVRVSAGAMGEPVLVAVDDVVGVRILVDQYLILGWVKPTKSGGKVVWSNEPPKIEARLSDLSRPVGWESVGVALPEIRTVRWFPYYDEGLTLRNERGYDPRSKCYLDRATPIVMPGPGETPLTVLAEWLRDFAERSFKAEHDMTYALASVLTLLLRPAIDGPVPMFAVMAAQQGTGKGKLVSALCRAAMGTPAAATRLAEDEDRQASELLSMLRTGTPAISIDNVRGKLGAAFGGDMIEQMLTEGRLSGRLLGTNTMVTVLVSVMVYFTANNPRFTPDMARRTIPINLCSTAERAEARSGWHHPDIDGGRGYTMRERARILGAFVALIEDWKRRRAAGETWSVWAPGSYEAWARIVGGICVAAGMPGWGRGIEEFKDASNPEDAAFRSWAEQVAEMIHTRWSERRTVHILGADIALTVNAVTFWAAAMDGKSGPAGVKRAWEIVKPATGRSWRVAARVEEIDGETRVQRPGGTLRFVKASTRGGGALAAEFEWSEDG